MSEQRPTTILCLSGYKKGDEFMRECKRQGAHVILLTLEKLRDKDWPWESIDDQYYLPNEYKREDIINAVSYLARSVKIDRIVALDDYDIETGAMLREHLRLPGMGDTTARYFRDKLAMRVKARDHGILVPDFVHVLNYDDLRAFMDEIPGPWVLKPRSEAAAIGIKLINSPEELWRKLDELGDRQSHFLMEKYVPGDIYHVDAITSEKDVVFALVSKYGAPPMDVAHGGGVFTTRSLPRESADAQALEMHNRELIATLGLVRGVTHTEFIKGRHDGRFYFLETAARVGGANIVETVEAATGINLWAEWARIELCRDVVPYTLPERRQDFAGIIISLARQEWPDTSGFTDPEIVWRLNKKYHVGLIVSSPSFERVNELLENYMVRILADYHAVQPLPDKPAE